jgi:hypothetical protein
MGYARSALVIEPPTDPPLPVPEPASWALIVIGAGLLGILYFIMLLWNFHKGEHGR